MSFPGGSSSGFWRCCGKQLRLRQREEIGSLNIAAGVLSLTAPVSLTQVCFAALAVPLVTHDAFVNVSFPVAGRPIPGSPDQQPSTQRHRVSAHP